MSSITIDLNSRVTALLALALGHKPDTVAGRLAAHNWLSARVAALSPDASGRNAAITDAILAFILRPDLAAEFARWRTDGKRFRPYLPTVEARPPLTERQKAKRLRNEIYRQRREEKARLKAEKVAAEQRQRDELASAWVEAYERQRLAEERARVGL